MLKDPIKSTNLTEMVYFSTETGSIKNIEGQIPEMRAVPSVGSRASHVTKDLSGTVKRSQSNFPTLKHKVKKIPQGQWGGQYDTL